MSQSVTDFAALRQQLASAPCLSIRQPWAELILRGRKKVELRFWSTRHRGWTWLHTGKTADEAAREEFGLPPLFTGGFLGAFLLRDVVSLDDERWDAWRSVHLDAGPFQVDSFGWVIGQVAELSHPLAAPGKRGLYALEAPTILQLSARQFVGEI
jgi:hypothetical protein